MYHAKVRDHYLTVTTPGGRDYISIRTKLNETFVNNLLKKANHIIYTYTIPAKINEKPEYFKCKMCDYVDICHNDDPVEKSCGTCVAFEIKPKNFYCNKMKNNISNQVSCKDWELNPVFATKKKKEKEPEKKEFSWIKSKNE